MTGDVHHVERETQNFELLASLNPRQRFWHFLFDRAKYLAVIGFSKFSNAACVIPVVVGDQNGVERQVVLLQVTSYAG